MLAGLFAALLLPSREQLREEMRHTLIGRDAAVLAPLVAERLAAHPSDTPFGADNLRALLRSGEKAGTLAMAVFDADGGLVQAVPASLPFVDLPPADYLELTRGQSISRYHEAYQLQAAFGVDDTQQPGSPVLEILLPLQHRDETRLLGVAQYWIDARALARELASIDARVRTETYLTLAAGIALIALIVALATWRLVRAERELAERNERLVRANLELSLAAKASVLGQITSHLLHGLQAPVAGLRAVVNARGSDAGEDWQTAADYTARLQQMIEQTVTLLGERQAHVSYELTPGEIAAVWRERHRDAASRRGVALDVVELGERTTIASTRGHLLCLIATNLIENALEASAAGDTVRVQLAAGPSTWRVEVADEGGGLPESVQRQLFRPGQTTKRGGTGLGLAISHLIARELGAELTLVRTGAQGTTFALQLPRENPEG